MKTSDFAIELAKECKKENISVVCETCGYCDKNSFLKLAKECDKVYFDVKLLDEQEFKKWTGGDLQVVLTNLELLQEEKVSVVIRCPIIGGVNDNEEHYKKVGELAKRYSVVERIELLPYNDLCVSKYEKINQKFEYEIYLPNNLLEAKNIIKYISKKEVIIW